jgi:beta-lactamase regulating signal transducer with metallopeptidase domain
MNWISHALVTFLVNSIIQVALIAGFALLCSLALRRAAAKYQYALWIAALLLSSLLPLWSLKSSNSPVVGNHIDNIAAAADGWRADRAYPNHTVAIGLRSRLSIPREEQPPLPRTLTLMLAGFYLAFLAYRVVGLGFAWRHARRLYANARNHSAPEAVSALVEHHAKPFSLKRTPKIYALDGIGPLTIGARPPILLMPIAFLETASQADLDAALCHELAHISRRDFQMNLICELTSLAISFHPAAWLIKSRINQTRELACDDLAAAKLSSPAMYANALVHIAQSLLADSRNLSASLAQGLFDTDNLERPVSNLIEKQNRLRRPLGRALALVMVSLLVGVTIGASAFSVQMTSGGKPTVPSPESSVQTAENSPHPRIRISQITFVETTKTVGESEIQTFAKQIESLDKLDKSWLDEIQERIREFWQDRGYFKVAAKIDSKLLSDSPDEKVFSALATVTPGSLYRLQALTFKGHTVFTSQELEAMFPIQPEDIVARDKIVKGLINLRAAYLAKGYANMMCIPESMLNDSDHRITLLINISETGE